MSSLLKLSTPDTYQALSEQYYNQRMLEVVKLTADKGMVYVSRFFTYFGPPALPCGLFAALCPKSITDFLAEYGSNHGPGSRGWMHNVLRSFLRFAYRAG
ncbi:MAG: hypothetical protein PHO37_18935 [Kiritimatiellae bacterium]|nr:hypothetical protein [Kiritimatiellia bacterium]